MSKLSFKGVGKDYGATTAVESFTLDVAPGEFVSLLGPSGCGKTTMLRMIAGFIAPTRGTIMLDQRLISSPTDVVPPEKRSMSMIFQSYAIWPNMTVAQNVAFGLELRKSPKAEITRRVGEILDVVRLGEHAQRYPAELSGGQQQRVALARAVVVKPEVLLLDEPLSNLDANLREEMRVEIRRIHTTFRITTVYVTHDQAEAMVTSDRIVVMSRGRVEQVATPRQVYRRPATRFVASFIGRTNFITGRRNGQSVDFPGFSVPAAALGLAADADGPVSACVRPHSLRLLSEAEASAAPGEVVCNGTVTERSYLGDRWDYTVCLADGTTLIASSEPYSDVEVGTTVRLAIDPQHISVLPQD